MRTGRLPAPTGDARADAVGQLRWAMAGAGLTVDKVSRMDAVLALPAVRAAIAGVPLSARAKVAYETVVAAATGLGDGVHARFLRGSLAIGYTGAGRNLTARRAEFVAAHNAATADPRNLLGGTGRAAYDVEHQMLGALVAALGAPAGGAAAHAATATGGTTGGSATWFAVRVGRAGPAATVRPTAGGAAAPGGRWRLAAG